MSLDNSNGNITLCQDKSFKELGTFNISQEYFIEMCNFSIDKRARFIYIILKVDAQGNFVSGYSGKKTADRLSNANSYYGSSSDSNFFKEAIQANRHLYKFIVIGYCKDKEELGDSEDAVNKYFKKEYGIKWSNKHLGNGKYSTEGLIAILKEDQKKFIKEEELDFYLSQGWSLRGHSTGLISIFKKDQNKFVKEEELDSYLSQGWSKGSTLKGLVSIVKSGEGKRIREEELTSYLSQGWKLGTSFMGLISIFKEDQNKFIREEELDSYLSQGWFRGTLAKGLISIFKGNETKRIKKEELDSYLSQGWSKGNKLNKGLIGITKDGKEKRVREEELDSYLSQGWSKGRLNSLLTLKKDFEEQKINLERLEDIIYYLKSDWKIPLKTIHIHNKSLLRGTSIILSENNSYTRLIEFLEKGWIFGNLPKELVDERKKTKITKDKQTKDKQTKEVLVEKKEKKRKVLSERDKENKRISANKIEVKERQRQARLGRKWCSNGVEELWLFEEEFNLKLKEGWKKGRLKTYFKVSVQQKDKKKSKLQESMARLESKKKRSKIAKEQYANKPMIDLSGNIVIVSTTDILCKLKAGWTLKLKRAFLYHPITKEESTTDLTRKYGHKNLISLLEQGWLFGHLPLEYKEEAEIEYGEYCEKRKMPALF